MDNVKRGDHLEGSGASGRLILKYVLKRKVYWKDMNCIFDSR